MKKQKKWILILLAVLAVLSIAYFAVIRPAVSGGKGTKLPPVELLEGEAYYGLNGNYSDQIPIAFPQVDRKDVFQIRISNGTSDYLFYHYVSDASEDQSNYFMLGQYSYDEQGEMEIRFYTPTIASFYEDFDYTTLYDDTSKIPAMIAASGAIVFKDRVYIRPATGEEGAVSDTEYQRILHRYGLADADQPSYIELTTYKMDRNGNYLYGVLSDETKTVIGLKNAEGKTVYYYADTVGYSADAGYTVNESSRVYTGSTDDLTPIPHTENADGSPASIRVYVGDMTPDDSGYYLYIEGREVVYTTGTTTIGDVVYKDLSYYVHPRIFAEADSDYTPYMPVSFRLWDKLSIRSDANGIGNMDSVVYSYGDLIRDDISQGGGGGVFALATDGVNDRIRAALTAAGVNVGSVMTLTEMTEIARTPTLAEADRETYLFYEILGIVEDADVIETEGTVVSDDDIVLVTYAGDDEVVRYGAVDLGAENTPAAVRTALTGLSVGAVFARADAVYDESTVSRVFSCTYQINTILGVATKEDLSDLRSDPDLYVPGSGYAVVEYEVEIDGARYTDSAVVSLADTAMDTKGHIREAIRGKKIGQQEDLSVRVDFPYDPFMSYAIYRDLKVEKVDSYEEEISFRFVNISRRDPYTGNSLYEVTGPVDRTVYALDASNCQHLLINFQNLVGAETVKVGLDDEAIIEYGLDAHILYYEMPFELQVIATNSAGQADYGHGYSLGFYLYISEADENGARYIGTSMYDTVVRCDDSEIFAFLDWDFMTNWLNRFILAVPVESVESLTFDINYSDLKETHSFAISHDPAYYLYADGEPMSRVYVSYVAGKDIRYKLERVSANQVVTDNREVGKTENAGKYYTQAGMQLIPIANREEYYVRTVEDGENLDQLYMKKNGWTMDEVNANRVDNDFSGVHNLKMVLSVLYTTIYSGKLEGELSDEKLAEVLADDSNRLFEVTMRIVADELRPNGRTVRLSFWSYSSGRCVVRLVDDTYGAESTEFFLHASEVKNLVTAVRTLVACRSVSQTDSYLPRPD